MDQESISSQLRFLRGQRYHQLGWRHKEERKLHQLDYLRYRLEKQLPGTNLTLRFGDGKSFTIHLYDNPTTDKIAEYVGTAAWQLPIYHYDDYDG